MKKGKKMNTQTQAEIPFITQVQRHGKRRSRRGVGTLSHKRHAKAELTEILEHDHMMSQFNPDMVSSFVPALSDYYYQRFNLHREAVQLEHTRVVRNQSYWYLLHHLGDVPLDMCSEAVNDLIDRVKATGSITFDSTTGDVVKITGKSLSNGTVNGILDALRAILNLAFEEGVILSAPKIQKLETSRELITVPAVEDVKKLLATARTLADRAPYLVEVIFLVMDTGLRKRELFSLKWKDVNFDDETIHIHQKGRERLGEGKAYQVQHYRERFIPMTKRVKAILSHLHSQLPNNEKELVIPNQNGAPYIPVENMNRKGFRGLEAAIKKAALQGRISFMSLRDLFAHRLLTQRVPVAYVADLMGYSNIRKAKSRYRHWVSDDMSNLVDFSRRWFDTADDTNLNG